MSKKFARSSLCALVMTVASVNAAEPPTSLNKGEGRLDIIAWPDISNAVRPTSNMIG